MLISEVIMFLQLARNHVIIPSIISQINIDDSATETAYSCLQIVLGLVPNQKCYYVTNNPHKIFMVQFPSTVARWHAHLRHDEGFLSRFP